MGHWRLRPARLRRPTLNVNHLPGPEELNIARNRATPKWTAREQCARVLWATAHPLFLFSPRVLWGWRRMILRLFGASVGRQVHVYPSVKITMPWNVSFGESCAVGDDVRLYALGPISLGPRSTISHGAHICAGTHDYTRADIPLVKSPISIGTGVWVCADAFVGPGVTVGPYAIIGARAVAVTDVEEWTIVAGNPAKFIKRDGLGVKVSTLILTLNEERNLPGCLGALKWCDDIIVVDSGSTDRTVEIATAHGARILVRPFDEFARQRNHGLEAGALRHAWVLHLDADEIVTPQFAETLAALQPREGVDGYRVPFKTIFFGRWLRHAGMWPAYQVRIGHAQRLRFIQVGHGQREEATPDRIDSFPLPIEHNSFSDGLKSWLDKHVRYARDEAEQLIADRAVGGSIRTLFGADKTLGRRAAKALTARLPLALRPFARFGYVYFWRRGFLDGRGGFIYAFMLSVYEGMIAILAYEKMFKDVRQGDRTPGARSDRRSLLD